MSHSPAEPRRHRLTVEDYYRMGEVGILAPDARVELIDGEIIDMPPIGSPHAGTVNQLSSLLFGAAGVRVIVQVQNPIVLGSFSAPQPDFALLRPRADFYKSRLPEPADVLLVIEVAHASLRHDRDTKAPLYARHAIPELWLVDVRAKRLVRYRNAQEGAYALVDRPDLGAPLEIAAMPEMRVDLQDLFGR
jgi:Uma2 family endonuclease